MVLEQIIDHKRRELKARRARVPLAQLAGARPSDRSLEQALAAPHTGFVLECKRASPSRGRIREDFDPAALAADYAPVADALSVLTDERFFEGRLDYLRIAREQVSVPVLCKDFILDPYQLFEARSYGADAVLLMLSVLEDGPFGECFAAAAELGLDALVEVHDAAELDRAVRLGARIVGINNRNLKTLEVDLRTTERLAPAVPRDRLVVAESGVRDHRDVVRLRSHAHAFLVGSSLMAATDVARASRGLVYGRVKVCGLTRLEDARTAAALGATHGGLVFAESPRQVTVEQARELCRAELDWVGVFVNDPPARVANIARELQLSAVQLHGEETIDAVNDLRRQLPPETEIWKAAPVRDHIPRLEETGADRLVLDAHSEGARGGTGRRFDWSLLHGHELGQVIVAGGLTPENVTEADRLGAYGLDVSSGVEQTPGRKSQALLQSFFAALRGQGRGP